MSHPARDVSSPSRIAEPYPEALSMSFLMTTVITTTVNTTTAAATTTMNTTIAETVDIIVLPELFPKLLEPEVIGTASKGYQVSGEALDLPFMDISGQAQATHLRIPATTFVNSFLVDEGSSVPDLDQVASNVIASPYYQECREAYFTACRALPSDDIEFTLIYLLNHIIELAPKCGLNMPDALHVQYIASPPHPDEEYGVHYCGVYFHNHPPKEGGWAIIALDVQRPDYIFKPRIYSNPEDQPHCDEQSSSSPPNLPSKSFILDNDTSLQSSASSERSSASSERISTSSQWSSISSELSYPYVPSKPPPAHSRVSPDPNNSSHEPVPTPLDMPDPTQLVRSAFDIMLEFGARRRHVFGILVKGMDVYLSYCDRAGSIFTERLDFVDDETMLVHILISLALCTPVQLGMEPGIHPSSASIIAAVSPDARGCTIDVEGRRFVIDDLIHKAGSEFGRGTTVFKAHPDRTENESVSLGKPLVTLPDTVVVKLSWQETSQESEDIFYRRAAKHNIEGIVKLYFSTVLGKLSEGGRGKALKPSTYTDRELRVQVLGPLCKPLYSVSDLDVFRTAYVSLIKAHHDLYEKAGILHRDISINNLMVDASDERVGVLIDFDLAIIVKDENGTEIDVEPMVTGTLPFLAIDLHEDPPSKHCYRHDLESFFWVLVWLTAYFDGGQSISTNVFDHWCHGHLRNVRDSKVDVLMNHKRHTTTPHYDPIEDSWIRRLSDLLYKAILLPQTLELIRTSKIRINEAVELEQMVEYVTYERFMAILHA